MHQQTNGPNFQLLTTFLYRASMLVQIFGFIEIFIKKDLICGVINEDLQCK